MPTEQELLRRSSFATVRTLSHQTLFPHVIQALRRADCRSERGNALVKLVSNRDRTRARTAIGCRTDRSSREGPKNGHCLAPFPSSPCRQDYRAQTTPFPIERSRDELYCECLYPCRWPVRWP